MPKPLAESFQFCPSCGAEVAQTGDHPFRCRECDFCFYFGPTSAVGGIVSNLSGEILFLIRGRDPGKGKYGLPGGFTDPKETLEQSLIREVQEETSLNVVTCEYLCSFPNQYDYQGFTTDVLDSFFVCTVDTFDNLKAQPGEVERFEICFPDERVLSNLAFHSNRLALEHYLQSRK